MMHIDSARRPCRLSVFLLPVRVQDGLMLASCASFFGKKEQG